MCGKENDTHYRKKLVARRRGNSPERITLTDEIIAQIKAEIARTGAGPHKLLREEPSESANRPSANTVRLWVSGDIKSAPRHHIGFVLKKWQSLPDDCRVKITPEQRCEMKHHQDRTGVGAYALMRGLRPGAPGRVEPQRIKKWMSGAIKSAPSDLLEAVLERWRGLPDKSLVMSVSDKHIAHVRAELARTGLSQPQVFRERKDIPKGLNYPVLAQFINGQRSTLRKEHYDYILRILSEAPTDPSSKTKKPKRRGFYKGRVGLSVGMRQALRDERDRTGVGQGKLTRIMVYEGQSPPPPTTIMRWLNGDAKSAYQEEYESVLTAWKALPTAEHKDFPI